MSFVSSPGLWLEGSAAGIADEPDMLQYTGTGTLVHHVTVGVREKGLPTYTRVHASEVPGSLRCELEVLSVEGVQLGPTAQSLGWPKEAYESLIHLKTGRTHQVGASGFLET